MLTKEEVQLMAKVEIAIQSVIASEIDMLKNGRVERTFTSHFANAIGGLIVKGNIRSDPFYNKHHGVAKMLDGKLIELDIAVHERNIDKNNLVAIELETNNTPAMDDLWKIKKLTQKLDGYGYKLGLYVVFGISRKAGQIISKEWFKAGKLLSK
jgi:hypothetical protein